MISDLSVWKTTAASRVLSGRQARHTTPELALRRRLHADGLRFRLHPQLGERLTADLVFPSARVVVFVDGCFWHGCPKHQRWRPSGPNAELWRSKFVRNRERDKRASEIAEEQGLLPLRVWECAIRDDLDRIAREIEEIVWERRRTR